MGLLALSIAVAVPAAGGAAFTLLVATAACAGLVVGALTTFPGTRARGTGERTGTAHAVLWLGPALGAGYASGMWRLPETRATASALACACALLRLAAMSHARRVAPPPC
ncbi:hypothetical protein [Streptomyces capoamus]|uniref:hypothetical protein n=1 Tax=Streptomyces capoamus TaxID=68183 RepID=UPI00339B1799